MKEIRIGIFGGFRGISFFEVINNTPGFKVVAIAEGRESTREEVKKVVGDAAVVCNTYEEMVEMGIDAVVLANFFHEHAKYAIRAMEAGIDVISETTAAPTLGECLDLVECCERTGRKYMLAANCPEMVGPEELMRVYQSGELGQVLYAEAEYLHTSYTTGPKKIEAGRKMFRPTPDHWRNFLPGCYYNMHSLGVLMAATKTLPRRVTAMDIYSTRNNVGVETGKKRVIAGIGLYEMDNGAVFRSTGCCHMGPSGKWYRLTCDKGTIETVRPHQDRVVLRVNGKGVTEYDPENQYTEEELKSGHGGADARICRQITDYLSGKVDEPIFDIYRGVALSLAGIYGHYSVLEGKAFDIPDIRDKEAREVLRGDYRSPFVDENGNRTLPSARYEM